MIYRYSHNYELCQNLWFCHFPRFIETLTSKKKPMKPNDAPKVVYFLGVFDLSKSNPYQHTKQIAKTTFPA